MAIIAIFCDGTWNRYDSGARTHVARLAEACATSSGQHVLYFEGVGTGTGMVSDLGRWISKMGGGVFGWGLNRNIKAAYLSLCRIHQPGDKIMVFGFSRGAYTARSLVGMIRKCGILVDPSKRNLDRAFRLYRRRGTRNAPDTPRIWAARRLLSPDYATSPEDVVRRADHSALVRIAYLGVWDTVGALGLPKSILGRVATLWNARYAFHDTTLTRLVEQARHAVALDEMRVPYEPSLWNNLDPTDHDPGLNHGDVSETRWYQQQWFAGSHAIVGGSAEPEALAAASLDWIWRGAEQSGLRLKQGAVAPEVAVKAGEDAPRMYRVARVYRWFPWLLQWRRGPDAMHQVHDTALLRISLLQGYRPATLRKVLPKLFGA